MTLLHQAAQKAVEAKQREAFEHWYSDAGRWPKSVARGEDGHYLLAQTNSSYEAWRAALSALQQQLEPVAPTFASAVARRKWESLQADGYRMQHIHFARRVDGHERRGTIDPWGKVLWGQEIAPPALQHQEVPREPVADLLRGLVNHWNEFGPEHGLDEMMDAAHRYLAASPSTTRQQDVGSDTARLHYLQCTESTVELLPCFPGDPLQFCIGGLRTAVDADLREAIDKAMAAAPSTPEKAGGVLGTSNDQGENRG